MAPDDSATPTDLANPTTVAVDEPTAHAEPDVEQVDEGTPDEESGLTVDAMEDLAARRGRAGMYVDPQVGADIAAARNAEADAAAQDTALETLAEAEPYIDPQVTADAAAADAEAAAAALPPEAMPVPDTYVDPLDGVPAAPTIAPAGQVLITHPDLPGPPIGSCFPEAFDQIWARNGWVLVDPPEPEVSDAPDTVDPVEPVTTGDPTTEPSGTPDTADEPTGSEAPTTNAGTAGMEG